MRPRIASPSCPVASASCSSAPLRHPNSAASARNSPTDYSLRPLASADVMRRFVRASIGQVTTVLFATICVAAAGTIGGSSSREFARIGDKTCALLDC